MYLLSQLRDRQRDALRCRRANDAQNLIQRSHPASEQVRNGGYARGGREKERQQLCCFLVFLAYLLGLDFVGVLACRHTQTPPHTKASASGTRRWPSSSPIGITLVGSIIIVGVGMPVPKNLTSPTSCSFSSLDGDRPPQRHQPRRVQVSGLAPMPTHLGSADHGRSNWLRARLRCALAGKGGRGEGGGGGGRGEGMRSQRTAGRCTLCPRGRRPSASRRPPGGARRSRVT
eukprot:SAG25_NODE_152_length_13602_cov_15.382878_8_plen_231_part_00